MDATPALYRRLKEECDEAATTTSTPGISPDAVRSSSIVSCSSPDSCAGVSLCVHAGKHLASATVAAEHKSGRPARRERRSKAIFDRIIAPHCTFETPRHQEDERIPASSTTTSEGYTSRRARRAVAHQLVFPSDADETAHGITLQRLAGTAASPFSIDQSGGPCADQEYYESYLGTLRTRYGLPQQHDQNSP